MNKNWRRNEAEKEVMNKWSKNEDDEEQIMKTKKEKVKKRLMN